MDQIKKYFNGVIAIVVACLVIGFVTAVTFAFGIFTTAVSVVGIGTLIASSVYLALNDKEPKP